MINLNQNEKYLVAVSGGPDSIFLLNQIKNFPNILVCHVNYHYREDSNYDQQVVEKFCTNYNIPLKILDVKVDYSNKKTNNFNFEEMARLTRYDFFVKVGATEGIKNLLVAHNMNDSVETYIMQKERNNNVDYYGLAKIGKYKNLTVIRPMLDLTKEEILNNLNINNIEYAIDSTNFDISFRRNSIRANLKKSDLFSKNKKIFFENEQLSLLKNEVSFYVNNNMTADELVIKKDIRTFEIKKVERIVFEFIAKLNKAYLVQKRSGRTINEISKTLQTSAKPFWTVKIDEYLFVKDFGRVYLIPESDLEPKTFKINSKDELYLIEEFVNWLEIFKAIKADKENYPYIVSTDFNNYKTNTFVKNEKTNRFFINKKISYKTRIYKAVVYQEKDKIILNKIIK